MTFCWLIETTKINQNIFVLNPVLWRDTYAFFRLYHVPVSFRWHTVGIRRALVVKSENSSMGRRFRVHVATGFWDSRNDEDKNNNKNNNTVVMKSNYSAHGAVTRIAEARSMFFIRIFFAGVEIALPKDLPLKKKKHHVNQHGLRNGDHRSERFSKRKK